MNLFKNLCVIITLLFVTTGCIQPSPTTPRTQQVSISSDETATSGIKIFYQVHIDVDDKVEIQRTTPQGGGGYAILELPQLYPISTLPTDELAVLSHLYCQDKNEDCSLENLRMRWGLAGFHLSPNKQWLALNERIIGCVNPSLCYGFHRLTVAHTEHPEKRVLLEIPLHVDLRTEQSINYLAWSVDSEQIAIVRSSEKGWSRVRVVDVETKQVADLSDGEGPIAWSPDGEYLAFGFRESSNLRSIRVINRNGTIIKTFNDNWTSINNLDWSPDSLKLVITASKEDREYQFRVFIANLMKDEITEISIPLAEPHSFTEAHWSPDGQLIGVTTSPTLVSPIDGLVIFHPQDGTIEANLEAKREVEEWFWSKTGDAILVNLSTTKRIGIFCWQEERLEKMPIASFLAEGLKSGDVRLKTPVW